MVIIIVVVGVVLLAVVGAVVMKANKGSGNKIAAMYSSGDVEGGKRGEP